MNRPRLQLATLFFSLFALFGFFVAVNPPAPVLSQSGTPLKGWAWSDNIGWVSLHCSTGGPATQTQSFTAVGTTNWVAPAGVTAVEYLVVGGGGGGGADFGGGGGGGGVRTGTLSVTPGGSYTVTVGGGGTGSPQSGAGSNGGNSVFHTITAAGGGRGSNGSGDYAFAGPGNGGSGGGGGGYNATAAAVRGLGDTPATSPAQGSNGGYGYYQAATPSNSGGGGGGGAGQVGTDAVAGQAGHGGGGVISDITGTLVVYGGGGGGGGFAPGGAQGGSGGAGGGGNGGTASSESGANGTANRGGGGGGNSGGGGGSGGNGGSGIVILRYVAAGVGVDVCGQSTYGLTLNTNNTVTGYAWSDNIGWIRFGGTGYPSNCGSGGTVCEEARVSGSNLTGWARGLETDLGASTVVVNTFTSSGSWVAPAGVTSVDYLIVGGGGGGGSRHGGGGAGGGVVYRTGAPVTPGTTYPVVVGAGGTWTETGPSTGSVGTNGGNSSFAGATALGGGGGGSYTAAVPTGGGSGGGGGGGLNTTGGTANQGNSGGGTGYGYNGGNGGGSTGGGGGGGAGAPGSAAAGINVGGAGAAGRSFSITGTAVTYAGGGGGGGTSGGGVGGAGGGGSGGNDTSTPGTNGLGGGGGGARSETHSVRGSNGGSGTVIIRYTSPAVVGYDGWIALSGTGYGVTSNACVGFNCNYAWGSNVVGWLSFNFQDVVDVCTDIGGPQFTSPQTCQEPNPSPGLCIPSGYLWDGTQCVEGAPAEPPSGCLSVGVESCSPAQKSQMIRRGVGATLYWNIADADSCTVLGTNGQSWSPATASTVTTAPIVGRTIFTLSCTSGGGNFEDQVTVTTAPIFIEI